VVRENDWTEVTTALNANLMSASVSNAGTPSKVRTRLVKEANTTPTLNNWRSSEFYDIIQLLEDMSHFDPSDDFYVGERVKNRAVKILSYIKECHTIDFPKILPEGAHCLSLTWEKGRIKSFLTVYSDEIESTNYHRGSGIRCVQSLGREDQIEFQNISHVLAAVPKPTTVDSR
jgi:hypothetical protein